MTRWSSLSSPRRPCSLPESGSEPGTDEDDGTVHDEAEARWDTSSISFQDAPPHRRRRVIAFSGPANTVVYASKDYGRVPVEKFCEVTGAIAVTGRFMPGTFPNPLFPGHLDAELVVVADPASDAPTLIEAAKMGIPVVAICDTDNITDDIDIVIPGNNRGRKALAAIFWLLARSVLTNSGNRSPTSR